MNDLHHLSRSLDKVSRGQCLSFCDSQLLMSRVGPGIKFTLLVVLRHVKRSSYTQIESGYVLGDPWTSQNIEN